MRKRTEETYKVVQYLFLVAMGNRKRKERTLKEIAKATSVGYKTVRAIILRLGEDECIKLYRYKYEFSEINAYRLHAIVSLKDKTHQRAIASKLRWFHEK